MDLRQLDIKSDSRGTLVEAFELPNDGQVNYITILPGETRGNHYHMRKTENFLVVFGAAEIRVKDRDTDNLMSVTVSGERPMAVSILANHTHNITGMDDGCICIVWIDEKFDPFDADTFPEEI